MLYTCNPRADRLKGFKGNWMVDRAGNLIPIDNTRVDTNRAKFGAITAWSDGIISVSRAGLGARPT